MINENSPIWQKQKPLCIAVFSGLPLSRTPNVAADYLNTMIVSAITNTGNQFFASTAGSTSIPTPTKNTAPNRFFTGVIILCITSASMVSASMAPITKAPNAVEKPTQSANTTMAKHKPTATMHSIYSVIHFLINLNIVVIR